MSRMLQALQQIETKKKPISRPQQPRVQKPSAQQPSLQQPTVEEPAPAEFEPLPPDHSLMESREPTTILTRSVDIGDPLPEVIDDINRVIEEVNKLDDLSLPEWNPQSDVQWVGGPLSEPLEIPQQKIATEPLAAQSTAPPAEPEVLQKIESGEPATQETPILVEEGPPPEEDHQPEVEETPLLVIEKTPPPEAEAEPEPVAEQAAEPVADAEPKPIAEAEPEPVAEAEPEPVTEAEPVTKTEPEPVAERPAPAFEPPTYYPAPQQVVEKEATVETSPLSARQEKKTAPTSLLREAPPTEKTPYSEPPVAAETPFSPSHFDEWIPNRRLEATDLEREIKSDLQDGPLAAQYRRLIDTIRRQQPGSTPASILLTTTQVDPHVADVAVHVAAEMASPDQCKVLLIDANPSASTLSKQFAAETKDGLTDILAARAIWTNVVRPTAIDGMDFLPCGMTPVTDRNSSVAKMAKTLDDLKNSYQVVLVAGSSGDQLLDKALARGCDAVYLLVRLGLTQTAEAASTIASLQASGARLLGCVVTNAPQHD